MPSMQFSREEAHQLLTAADTVGAAGGDPALADLYRSLATQGIDLDACTPDEQVREDLGMPPIESGEPKTSGGDHPRVA